NGDPLPKGAVARFGSARMVHDVNGSIFSALMFSPDGKLLASRSRKEIRVWDLADGRELSRHDIPWLKDWNAALLSNGLLVADTRDVRIIDFATSKTVQVLESER